MDTVFNVLNTLCILGLFVPLSAVIKPWGPFKRRWMGGAAAFASFLAFALVQQLPPDRPANIPQPEWDRRIALCRAQDDGEFRDCVRDAAELKKAEQKAAEAKKEADAAQRAQAAADNADKPLPPDPNDKRQADNPKITLRALEPYTRKDDPDIFGQWGAKGVQRIEALRRAAAYAVAKKDTCDVVDITDIADQRSKAPSSIVIYVQCRNDQQSFLSQAEIEQGAILSEGDREEAVKALPFRNACSEGAQSLLRYPSSYNQYLFGGGTFKDKDGNYGLAVDFDAQNGFGNKLPQVALCTQMPNGKIKIQIRNR